VWFDSRECICNRPQTESMAESDDATLRSGFQLVKTYRGHRNPIRHVVFNHKAKQLLSVDERCAKLWKTTGQEIATINFPPGQQCFLTHIVYVAQYNLYFATALDRCLKIYDDKLQLLNSMPWGKNSGVPALLTYNPKQDEVITAGLGGVKVWGSALDTAGLGGVKVWGSALDGKREVVEVDDAHPAPSAALPAPPLQCLWRRRRRVALLKRLELHLPFLAGAGSSNGRAQGGSSATKHTDESWVKQLYLNTELELLFIFWSANLYVYNVGHLPTSPRGKRKELGDALGETGFVVLSPCYVWAGLHDQPITVVTMMVVPNHTRGGSLIITGARDSKVKVWRQKAQLNQISYVRSIGAHTKSVSWLELHPQSSSVLTAALDGSVQMWSLDSYEAMHRAKLSSPVLGLTLIDSMSFFLHTDAEVKIFRLVHLHDTFSQYNSPIVGLQSIDDGMVLMMCEDSSARLVDTVSGESMSTTVPQLSTKSLIQTQYSKAKQLLYILLAHGEIHVYSTKTNPSVRREVWTTTLKERVSCISLCHAGKLGLDGAPETTSAEEAGGEELASDAPQAKGSGGEELASDVPQAKGLSGELLVAGTQDGDFWFVQTANHGNMVRRQQSHRNVALKAVLVAADLKMLVTLGDPKGMSTVKLWHIRREGTVYIKSVHFNENVICMNYINRSLITGHVFGSIRLLNLVDGSPVAVPQAGDHSGKVLDIKVNAELEHFLTCSNDGSIKVFDSEKRLEQAMAMESPISCVCYLNGKGDILAGFGDRLIVIRANLYINHRRQREERSRLRDAYNYMTNEDERAVPTEALLKMKELKAAVDQFSEHGDYDEDDSDYASSDSDDERSCEDLEIATDSIWGPRQPRDPDNPRVPAVDWDDTLNSETVERLHAQLTSGNFVPLLNLPGQVEVKKKKKKKKKKMKKNDKPSNEFQLVGCLERKREAGIAFGLQEYKALNSITSHIQLLPLNNQQKSGSKHSGTEKNISPY